MSQLPEVAAMPIAELSPAQRRWFVIRALARALFTTAGLVALYYVLPLKDVSSTSAGVILAVGLTGVVILVWWHMRAILKSDYPAMQAIEALAMITPLFLVSFAVAYFEMEQAASTSFTQHLSRTDALYFTITTFATVGYGDITAKTEVARVVVMVQMILDLVIVGFGVRAIFGAVQIGRKRRAGGEGDPPSP